jgi:hypothetical protein
MQQQLEAAVQEMEQALLQLKRDRLLRQLDAMTGSSTAAAEHPSSEPAAEPPAAWESGQQCVFRSTDGRFYLGSIDRLDGETAHLRFAIPTRCGWH